MVFHAAYGYSGFDEPGSTRRKAIVCSFKIAVTSIAAFAAISVTGSVSRADTRSGFFIADAGATSVRYLFMNDNRDAVSSYLEAILPSAEAPDGLRRVKLLGKRTGESFFFGPYLAVRDGDGYTLTTIGADGHISQQRFFRTNVRTIDALATVLCANAMRDRMRSARSLDTVEVRSDNAALAVAQGNADRLSRLARNARGDADASLDTSGATLAQNLSRIQAMAAADVAEQSGVAAAHAASISERLMTTAIADVTRLQSNIDRVTARARAASLRLIGSSTDR
jgi:hypothetical protein